MLDAYDFIKAVSLANRYLEMEAATPQGEGSSRFMEMLQAHLYKCRDTEVFKPMAPPHRVVHDPNYGDMSGTQWKDY